jgi:hypothetical protein
MYTEEKMDSLEDLVDLVVPTSPRPPPFDDTSIVSINLEASAWSGFLDNKSDEKFHPDCLCPGNVSSFVLPTGFEDPSFPSIADDDTDPN